MPDVHPAAHSHPGGSTMYKKFRARGPGSRAWLALLLGVAGSAAASGAAVAAEPVQQGPARAPAREANEWPHVGGDIGGTYFSPLRQINNKNVQNLGFAWEYRTGSRRGLEATPIVVGNVMYTSGNWGVVYAVDAATGKSLWTFDPKANGQTGRNACCDVVNRGVAVRDNRVYVAANNGQLYSLDAKTGGVVWSADTFIAGEALSSTGAPQLAGDAILIGNSGADLGKTGVRGYVSAYEVASAKLRWRFFIVPSKEDKNPSPAMRKAAATWDPKVKPQGGTVWAGTAYDPALDLIYVGTGNAAPYQPEDRNPSGGVQDNLYTDCVLALKARTGELAWSFQTTPGDNWDYDATEPLVQADLVISGRVRHVLMQASKNGYFYVWDRASGELLSGKPFTYINWSRGLDSRGRPQLTQAADYSHEPQLIYPSTGGAHSWPPMSYSPETKLVYIPVLDSPMIWVDLRGKPVTFVELSFGTGNVFPDKDYNPADWEQWFGKLPDFKGTAKNGPRRVIRGVLRAWDPVAQKTVWERETSSDYFVYDGGTMSTAGNLVVQGRASGELVVYSADKGEVLKTIQTGVGIMAAPMTYSVNGEQYIAVMEGYGGSSIGIPFPSISAASKYANVGRIVAFRLGGGQVPLPDARTDAVVGTPPQQHAAAADIQQGALLYASYCSRCHVFGAGILPDLRKLPEGIHSMFEDIVLKGRLSALGMGRFDDVLSERDVKQIHAYLIDEQGKLAAAKPSTAQ
jgi:quinohemoprotein ethanol dehydrogenase